MTEERGAFDAIQGGSLDGQTSRLAEAAFEFLQLSPDADVFDFIAQQVHAILQGRAVVVVTEFSPAMTHWRVRALAGVGRSLRAITAFLGRSPVRIEGRIPPHLRAMHDSNSVQHLHMDMAELTGGVLSTALFARIRSVLGLGELYTVSFRRHGVVYGNIAMLMKRGAEAPPSAVIEAFTAVASAVLERQRAEADLQASERRYRTLVEHSSDALYVVARDGAIQDVNERACVSTGYARQELLDLCIWDIEQSASKVDILAGHASLFDGSRESIMLEGEHRRRDGSTFPVEVHLRLMPGPDGEPLILGLARDITSRRQAEARQRLMEAQLRHQQKLESIGTLAGGVAHEINNPITGIMNYAELIRDSVAEPDSTELVSTYAGEIIHETRRVASLVRNLLRFARQDRRRHGAADVATLVEEALTLIRTVIRRDHIDLRVTLSPDLPPLVCHSQQIQQVIVNLLTNARDALNEKYADYDADKILVICAEPFRERSRDWIRLTVKDHGPGLSDRVKECMFDPFFTTKPPGVGTGLGLSISHGIVTEHGGRIRVESEPGSHTCFHIELPAAPPG